MHSDQRGLETTAASEAAVRHYDETITAYLGFARDTGARLKETLAADPELVLGHCLKGYFFQLFCNPALDSRAAQSLAAAQSAAAHGATERERQHVTALAAWCERGLAAAGEAWEAILLDHPRDMLALRLAGFAHFYRGDARNMRDSIARVLPAWDEDVPGYGFVLGAYAFGLEEAGDYAAAEEVGRRAVALNAADPWAVHAVAHVMEMHGRAREGVDWIAGLEGSWSGCNNFAYHLWWHRSLFHLELGEVDEVLSLYDSRVRTEPSDDYLDVSNAVSMLWRLEHDGIDVGERWAELADTAEARGHDHVLAFADAHFIMALAAEGREAACAEMLDSMRAVAGGPRADAELWSEVALPLCGAVLAYGRGAFDACINSLLSIRYEIVRVGGSHAQRDVFAEMLIEAALRAGRPTLARALLAERTALKPQAPRSWRRTAQACEALGDADGARAANDRARGA